MRPPSRQKLEEGELNDHRGAAHGRQSRCAQLPPVSFIVGRITNMAEIITERSTGPDTFAGASREPGRPDAG